MLMRLLSVGLLLLLGSHLSTSEPTTAQSSAPDGNAIVVDGTSYPQTAQGINAAIAKAANGQTVWIPNSFSINATIAIGHDGVTLSCARGAQLTLADNSNRTLLTIGGSNIRITGCGFDGNRSHQTAGFGIITTSPVKSIRLDHNQIENVFNDCVVVGNVSDLHINENHISNCSQVGNTFAINYSMHSVGTKESDITITGNDIDQSQSSSGGINVAASVANGVIQNFHLDHNRIKVGDADKKVTMGIQAFANGSPGNIVSDGTIDRNEIDGPNATNSNAWGISIGLTGVANGNVTASGNTIRDTRSVCIEGIGSNVAITDNTCDDTDGIQVPTNSARVNRITVTGNILTNGSGADGTFAQIGVSGSGNFPLSGAKICNNSISYVPPNRWGIFFNGNPTGQITDSTICNNKISGRSSGMAKNAIQIGQAANISIKGNTVTDWVGQGTVAIRVDPRAVTSTIISGNIYNNVTSGWADSGKDTAIEDSAPVAFRGLGNQAEGSKVFCQNCASGNPCRPGGSGATATRSHGTWICN